MECRKSRSIDVPSPLNSLSDGEIDCKNPQARVSDGFQLEEKTIFY